MPMWWYLVLSGDYVGFMLERGIQGCGEPLGGAGKDTGWCRRWGGASLWGFGWGLGVWVGVCVAGTADRKSGCWVRLVAFQAVVSQPPWGAGRFK